MTIEEYVKQRYRALSEAGKSLMTNREYFAYFCMMCERDFYRAEVQRLMEEKK